MGEGEAAQAKGCRPSSFSHVGFPRASVLLSGFTSSEFGPSESYRRVRERERVFAHSGGEVEVFTFSPQDLGVLTVGQEWGWVLSKPLLVLRGSPVT